MKVQNCDSPRNTVILSEDFAPLISGAKPQSKDPTYSGAIDGTSGNLHDAALGKCTPMNHERDLIKAFIQPTKRARYLEMIAHPKKRKKFRLELSHFKSLDPRYCFAIPKAEHSAEQLAAFLHRKGAPQTCWITSDAPELDGKEMPLVDALKEVLGREIGTFLSCVPGKLAYFEDEDDRWILERHD